MRVLGHINNDELRFLPVFAVLILISNWFYLPEDFLGGIGGGGWGMCLDYASEGTLYGGQPYCNQGPIIYHIGYLLDLAVGSKEVMHGMWVLEFMSYAVVFLVLRRILINDDIYDPAPYFVLFPLMIYRFVNEITSSFALCLFMLGFYNLYHSKSKLRGAYAGIAFTLAIFTKFTTVIPILVLAGYYVAAGDKRLLRQRVLNVVQIVECAILGLIIASYLFPNILIYTIHSQTELLSFDLKAKAFAFASKIPLTGIATALVAIPFAYAVRVGFFKRNGVYIVMQVALLAQAAIFFMSHMEETKVGTYYLLPVYPFLLGALLVLWRHSKAAFTFAVVCAFVYPAMFPVPFFDYFDSTQRQFGETNYLVEYGLHYVPTQSGKVLIEGLSDSNQIFKRYDSTILDDDIVRVPPDERGYTSWEDHIWGPKIRKLIEVRSKNAQAYDFLTPKQQALRDEILEGRYSLIMFGPPQWLNILGILNSIKPYIMENYCVVKVPTYQYAGSGLYMYNLLFKNKTDCEMMNSDLSRYYTENFERICSSDPSAASVVLDAADKGGYSVRGSCTVAKKTVLPSTLPFYLNVSLPVLLYSLIAIVFGMWPFKCRFAGAWK